VQGFVISGVESSGYAATEFVFNWVFKNKQKLSRGPAAVRGL
jgi:hypothetical protein